MVLLGLVIFGSLGIAAFRGLSQTAPMNCVQIYFDSESRDQLASGKAFAQQLRGLLAPYIGYAIHSSRIADYQSGEVHRCDKNIYVGTHFDHRVPRVFVEDFMNSKGSVAWFGYNIWQMGPRLENEMGLRFLRMARQEFTGFFDEVLYEGGFFKKTGKTLAEQVELLPSDMSKFSMLAESRNSVTREIVPYIVQSKNRFYVADVPTLGEAPNHISLMFTEVLARFMEGRVSEPSSKQGKLIAASESKRH
ncbi:hypothetical protein B9G79_10600 [Bdellovibrio bacteriovorus]|uniref:Uncharacterized protein n=2 Tax=Bdellovibrio bacteriovorus TaxID=959 RepID=A0A1Z3NDE0_BDEBC|nr:hypothetical protein B9G79_10600 [Bdellovibrio bacteriovorus]